MDNQININNFFNSLIVQLEKYEDFEKKLFFSYELNNSTLILKKEIKENNTFDIIVDIYGEAGNILSFKRSSEESSYHLYKNNLEIIDNYKDIVLQSLNLTAFYYELYDRFDKKETKIQENNKKIQIKLTEEFIKKFQSNTSFFIAVKELGKNLFNNFSSDNFLTFNAKSNSSTYEFLKFFSYSIIFLKNSELFVNEKNNLTYQNSNKNFNIHLNISSERPDVAILSLFDKHNLDKKESLFEIHYHFNKEPNLFKKAQFFVNNIQITNEELIFKLSTSKILQEVLQQIQSNVIDNYYIKNPMVKTTLDDLNRSEFKDTTHSTETVLNNILKQRLSFNDDDINSTLTKKIN